MDQEFFFQFFFSKKHQIHFLIFSCFPLFLFISFRIFERIYGGPEDLVNCRAFPFILRSRTDGKHSVLIQRE